MSQDAQGHHLSGATPAAIAPYDQAMRAFNLIHGDAVGLFDAAREAASEFAMASLGKAWVFALANDPGLLHATQRRLGVSLTNASALLWRLDTLGIAEAIAA